jgi:hypothetical protein
MAEANTRPEVITAKLKRLVRAIKARSYMIGLPLKWSKLGEGKIVPKDPFIREKFTREHTAAGKLAEEYFARYPKEWYQTEVESWRNLQSANIEFTMRRRREPIEAEDEGNRRT